MSYDFIHFIHYTSLVEIRYGFILNVNSNYFWLQASKNIKMIDEFRKKIEISHLYEKEMAVVTK